MSVISDMEKRLEILEKELRDKSQQNQRLVDYIEKREEIDKEKRNQNFVQLYKQYLTPLRDLTVRDHNALSILLIMVEKMNKQNALVASQQTLMKLTGKSRSTVSIAIKILRELNYINVAKIGTANAYIVNSDIFWQDSHDKKHRFATFEATVICDAEEQDVDYFKNKGGLNEIKLQ